MRKILYFDDEPSYVKLLINNLELNHGWTADKKGKIRFISDPAEMIDEINSSNQYDLFILDIMISSYGIEKKGIFEKKEVQRIERDNNMGILIAEKIRTIDKYKETPIIFVTAKGNGRAQSNAYIDEEETQDVGMDIFSRGLCLPSDNKMTAEEQDRIIEVIHRAFD